MTSSINPFTIDQTYPISGQDNDTQGFRANFIGIQDNFIFAKSEIEVLQNTSISSGASVTNDLLGAIIKNAEFQNNSLTVENKGLVTGTVTFDYLDGHVQSFTTTGNVTMAFTNWPATSELGYMLVEINITGALTVTLPGIVITPPDFVVQVDGPGTYWYEFITRDSGATIHLFDRTRSYGANTGDINISGNTISTISINTDINITPNGTGNVNVGPELIFDGNTIRTTNTNASLQLIPAGTGSIELGTQIAVDGNTISTILTNANINLDPSGTGNIVAISGSFVGPLTGDVTGDLTGTIVTPSQTNITSVGNLTALTVTGNITGSQIAIQGNDIVALNTNSDINITPAGTGQVVMDQISIGGNNISTNVTNANLELTPTGTGKVSFGVFTGTGDTATNGYIEIVDALGNTRRLATVA